MSWINTYFQSIIALNRMGKPNTSIAKLIYMSTQGIAKYERYLIPIYKAYLSEIMKKYEKAPFCSKKSGARIIWTCWWQGEETAPAVVKHCFSQMRKLNPSLEVVVISKKNYGKYLDIEPEIIELVQKGIISITFLSDYIRTGVLANYGGAWVDSTIYMTRPINPLFFESILYTNRLLHDSQAAQDNVISEAQWSGFYIGSGYTDCILFKVIHESLKKIMLNLHTNPYYFSIDLIIRCAYDSIIQIRDAIDSISYSSPDIHIMSKLWNEVFDKSQFEAICKRNEVFKLSTKWNKDKSKANALCYHNFFTDNS